MAEWPVGADLAEWMAGSPVSAARSGMHDMIVAASTDVVWGDLDPAKMPDQDGPVEARCPDSVRMAVLLLAARVDSRRQSAHGVISSGELFVRVSQEDPDYRRLISRYAVSAVP